MTYEYNKRAFPDAESLAQWLHEKGFIGDIEDLDYITVYVDDITYSEAEEICDRLQELYKEELAYMNGETEDIPEYEEAI